MKDLPKVFANPIDKNVTNNRSSIYEKLEEKKNDRNERAVQDKIDKIFKSDSTIYSIDCLISLEDRVETHTIIGKTSNNLVTKHQKLIPIKDIYDISLP